MRGRLQGSVRWKVHPAPPARPLKELTKCPACKKPVRKLISTFNSPKKLSLSHAKNAGFKVYKKLGKGEYELQ